MSEQGERFAFWDAVNEYAESRANRAAINSRRMDAVVSVNKEVDVLIQARLERAVVAERFKNERLLDVLKEMVSAFGDNPEQNMALSGAEELIREIEKGGKS